VPRFEQAVAAKVGAALATKLEHAEQTGRLPKIVIPAHFAGQPCDMPAIAGLAKHYENKDPGSHKSLTAIFAA
jgi:dTDP-4-amino-4,6-dideoxygalactose transaminase